MNKKYILQIWLFISLCLLPNYPFGAKPAVAALMEQTCMDARSMSLANSVTAATSGIMAIHYNPAGLSKNGDGGTFGFGLSGARVDMESRFIAPSGYSGEPGFGADPAAGQKSKIAGLYGYSPFLGIDEASENLKGGEIFPSFGGIVYRKPESDLTAAWGFYTPLAGGFYYDDDDPAVYGGKAAYFSHFVYSAPAFGYRITDTLSAGMTFCMGYTAHGMTMPFRPPKNLSALTGQTGGSTAGITLPLTPDSSMPLPWYGGALSPYEAAATMSFELADQFSPSANIGFLWEPVSSFSIGLCYQSAVQTVMTGDYRFDYSRQWQTMIDWFGQAGGAAAGIPSSPVAFQKGRMVSELKIPQMAHAGLRIRPVKGFSMMADIHWAEWSAVKENIYKFDQNIHFLQMLGYSGYTNNGRSLRLPRKMEDTINWSVGIEMNLNEGFIFRCGYEDRKTSVNEDYFDLTVPITDMAVYGAGFGILFENGIRLDLALTVMDGEKYNLSNNSSRMFNSSDTSRPVYNPYSGLDFQTEVDIYIAGFSISIPFSLKPERKKVFIEKSEEDVEFEKRMDILNRRVEKVEELDREIKKRFEKVIEKESEEEIKKKYEKVEKRESETEVLKLYEKLEERETEERIIKIHEKVEEKESEEEIKKRFEEAIRKEVEEEVKKRFEKILEKKLNEARVNKTLEEKKRGVNITPFEEAEKR